MAPKHRTRMANQSGPSHRFRVKPLTTKTEAPGALPAKKCSCEVPWVERDVDEAAHCAGCGRDI